MRSGKPAAWAAAVLLGACALAPAAQAQDFFSQLFGGPARPRQQPYISMPFSNEDGQVYAPRGEGRVRYSGSGGGQAFCVRTCDGRYFPVTGSDNASRAASCNSFCPASETKVFSGSNIDNATADNGVLFGSAERVPLSQRARQRLHLQWQGPTRSRAGEDRKGSDAAQGRHRRRRERPPGRRPQRRSARRRVEFLARLRQGPRQI